MASFSQIPNNKCCYICGSKLYCDSATKDHFIPRSCGGSNDVSNLRPACMFCNRHKSNLIPAMHVFFAVYVCKKLYNYGVHSSYLQKLSNPVLQRVGGKEGCCFEIIHQGVIADIFVFLDKDGKLAVSYTDSLDKNEELFLLVKDIATRANQKSDYFSAIASGIWPVACRKQEIAFQDGEVYEEENNMLDCQSVDVVTQAAFSGVCCEICGDSTENSRICSKCAAIIFDLDVLDSKSILVLKKFRKLEQDVAYLTEQLDASIRRERELQTQLDSVRKVYNELTQLL